LNTRNTSLLANCGSGKNIANHGNRSFRGDLGMVRLLAA
jgi:hypothetical protein